MLGNGTKILFFMGGLSAATRASGNKLPMRNSSGFGSSGQTDYSKSFYFAGAVAADCQGFGGFRDTMNPMQGRQWRQLAAPVRVAVSALVPATSSNQ